MIASHKKKMMVLIIISFGQLFSLAQTPYFCINVGRKLNESRSDDVDVRPATCAGSMAGTEDAPDSMLLTRSMLFDGVV